jgi:hypothetical protein
VAVYFSGDKFKKKGMGVACSAYGVDERHTQRFGGKQLGRPRGKWEDNIKLDVILLKTTNQMQIYAAFYLLPNHSTCFGCSLHPSSGVHTNVVTTTGTCHESVCSPTLDIF